MLTQTCLQNLYMSLSIIINFHVQFKNYEWKKVFSSVGHQFKAPFICASISVALTFSFSVVRTISIILLSMSSNRCPELIKNNR